jgi:hypothetical protein
MSTVVTRSFKKQLEHVRHQPVQEYAQEQDERQVQPMGDELVNALKMDATQKGEVNEQHQNVAKPIV